MSPERWREVKRIFLGAAELPGGARSAFLDDACAGDEALRREVDELLASDAAPARLLDAPAATPPELGGLHGRRIGPWELERELGRGGMGVVYLAARADGDFEQRAAVKLIRPGLELFTGEGLAGRFRQERRILAQLEHPGIARLLDGGESADGLLYLAMEYVDGMPIDAYCAHHGLGVRQRLELFAAVCDAVAFAHQNLVVHRDLKPGNILVTGPGEPKLLDFGIAKLLDPTRSLPAVSATGQRFLTLDYASPEQVRGEVVGTAADVYSLGVVLYELLTGTLPYRSSSPRERAICEEEPEKPSTAVARDERRGERRRRRLAGDLDNILLLALRKEPQRRYRSVTALAEDLRRHLAGLPVAARPDTLGYRAGKFLRRHAAAVAAGLLVVAALVAGIVTTAWQARRARSAQVTAERVSDFLIDLLQVPDPFTGRGEELTVREALDRGAAQLAGGLEDQPEVRARLLATLGAVYLNLGLLDSAAPHLEEAYALRRATLGEDHPETGASLDKLGELHYLRGDLATAETLFRRSLALRRRRFSEDSPEVTASLNNLAGLLGLRGRFDEAEPMMRDVLVRVRRLQGERHPEVAAALHNLGEILRRRGAFDEAEALFEEALAIGAETLGEQHPYLARGLESLAELHLDRGHPEAAEPLLRRALAIRRRSLPADHPEIDHTLSLLAKVEAARGERRDRAADPTPARPPG